MKDQVITSINENVKMHRAMIVKTLIQHDALKDRKANQQCLQNVGAVLGDEVLSYNGLYLETPGELARRCVKIVTTVAPELINATDEYGFTPLMCAVEFHDELAVKALIEAGAEVNAATSLEYDHRTALKPTHREQASLW